jgi:predicted  nucleic acid-binding Zn-ribbon protein
VTIAIDKLLKVQSCDLRLMRLRKEISDIPARKLEIESRLEGHREAVTKAKELIKTRQASLKQLDVEIETHKEHIRKLREQQLQLKTNKEFKTMESEIGTIQNGIASLEDRTLSMMDQIDQAQTEVKQRENELLKERDLLQADFQFIDQRQGEIQAELDRLEKERQQLVVGIDATWLQRYDRLITNKKDAALVSVENGACGGCHMRLPPYLINDARKQSEIVVCGYCGRMLYVPAL